MSMTCATVRRSGRRSGSTQRVDQSCDRRSPAPNSGASPSRGRIVSPAASAAVVLRRRALGPGSASRQFWRHLQRHRRSVHVAVGVVTQPGEHTGLLDRILAPDKHADSIVNASRNARDRIWAVLQGPPNLEVGSSDRERCPGLRVRHLVGCGTEVQRGSRRQTSEESRPDVDLFTRPTCVRTRRHQSRRVDGGALLRHRQGRQGGSGNLFLGCQGAGRGSVPLFR